jgi:hypothetical protein
MSMNLPQAYPLQPHIHSHVETLLSLLHQEKRVLDELIAGLEPRRAPDRGMVRRRPLSAGVRLRAMTKRS